MKKSSNSHPNIFSAADVRDMVAGRDKWLDNVAPLDFLDVENIRTSLNEATRGAHARLQWTWEQLEPADSILASCVDRRASALGRIQWDFVKRDDLSDTEATQAESQLRTLRDFSNQLLNLDEAISALGQASFRHYKILQLLKHNNGFELLPTDNWNWARDGYRGDWTWNPRASFGATKCEAIPVPLDTLIIRQCARPIDQVAMMLVLDRKNAKAQWMTYNARYGVPPLFVILPNGISADTKDAYLEFARQCVSNASGALPNGSDVKTIAPNSGTPDTFSRIVEMADREIVLRATGGLMTMLAAPGEGTNTGVGNAHQDGFDQLAAQEAKEISELLNRSLFGRILEQYHPNENALVTFSMVEEDAEDTSATVNNIVALAGVGYKTPSDQVREKTGLEVEYVEPIPVPTATPMTAQYNKANSTSTQVNSTHLTPEKEDELTPSEQAALKALLAPPSAESIANVADALKSPLEGALKLETSNDPQTNFDAKCNAFATPQNADEGTQDDEEMQTNGECRSKTGNCRVHNPASPRESKTKTGKTNPFTSPDSANDKVKEKTINRAVERVRQTNKPIHGVITKDGIGKIDIKPGTAGNRRQNRFGASGLQHVAEKHPEMRGKLGRAIVQGVVAPSPKKETRKEITDGSHKVIVEHEINKGSGRISKTRAKLHTAYPNKHEQ